MPRSTGTQPAGRGPPTSGGPRENDVSSTVLTGRPDLEKDALKELRERQRALKSEAKRVATDLKNKKKQKKRALKKCAALDTRDIVQVLLERGVVMPAGADSASPASSSATHSHPADMPADASAVALIPVAMDALPSDALPAIEG